MLQPKARTSKPRVLGIVGVSSRVELVLCGHCDGEKLPWLRGPVHAGASAIGTKGFQMSDRGCQGSSISSRPQPSSVKNTFHSPNKPRSQPRMPPPPLGGFEGGGGEECGGAVVPDG